MRWDGLVATRNGVEPPYWVVREGPTLIAATALMPVRVSIGGNGRGDLERRSAGRTRASAPGLGGSLLRAGIEGRDWRWAPVVKCPRGRLDEMLWPKTDPAVPREPISRRLSYSHLAGSNHRLVSAITLPVVRLCVAPSATKEEIEVARRFDGLADRYGKTGGALPCRFDAIHATSIGITRAAARRYQIALLRRVKRSKAMSSIAISATAGRVTQSSTWSRILG